MRNTHKLPVTVQKLEAGGDKYVATFQCELYGATFSVCFPDNLKGAFALHAFAETIPLLVTRQG